MIKLIKQGKSRLVVTGTGHSILYLGQQGYFWKSVAGIGEILVFSKHPHKLSHVLSHGEYKLYRVKDEPRLVDLEHLELHVGKDKWQGYLLLTGLPTANKIRSRIVPTNEVITKE